MIFSFDMDLQYMPISLSFWLEPWMTINKKIGGIPYCLKKCQKTRAFMGINSITLSYRLKELEKHCLIQREALAETPPKVDTLLSARSI